MYLATFVLIRFSKMTDVETRDLERRVCYLQCPRGRGTQLCAGPHGEAPGKPGSRRSDQGGMAQGLYCGSCGKDWERQVRRV